MSLFFLVIEPLIYIGGGYLLFYKKDLAILYLPALFFAHTVIVSVLPAVVGYAFFSFYIGYLIYLHPTFIKANIFAFLLFILHLLLIPGSSDLVFIRPTLFAVLWMLLLVPLAMTIVSKYPRTVLLKELVTCVVIILALFLANVLFSTVFNYSPYEMYGIQSGILYGELVDTDFNILAIAIFVAFFFLTYKMNLLYLMLTLASLAVIGLSMRRSVIGACVLAFIFILLVLIVKGQANQVFGILGVIMLAAIVVVLLTDFTTVFQERFEQRNLAQRSLAGEMRFAEYALLYKDAFVHHDFNPWVGYELLNSGGNYGKGIFGSRSLHGDITNIIHSTGIIGLTLYFLMVLKVFLSSIHRIQTPTDKLIILFCAIVFFVFTITGRYSQTGYMTLFFLLLCLPMGKVGRPEPVSIPDESPSAVATK